jgi:hypothetical protein
VIGKPDPYIFEIAPTKQQFERAPIQPDFVVPSLAALALEVGDP